MTPINIFPGSRWRKHTGLVRLEETEPVKCKFLPSPRSFIHIQKRYISGDDGVLGVLNTQLILRLQREPGHVPKLNICRQIGWRNRLVLRNNFLLSSFLENIWGLTLPPLTHSPQLTLGWQFIRDKWKHLEKIRPLHMTRWGPLGAVCHWLYFFHFRQVGRWKVLPFC